MPVVRIEGNRLTSFEAHVAEAFGFPDFYGRNMDAWIDCMSDLDRPNHRMTTIHGTPADPVVIEIDNAAQAHDGVLEALRSCTAFVNERRTGPPILHLIETG